jgi:hypothetical protein
MFSSILTTPLKKSTSIIYGNFKDLRQDEPIGVYQVLNYI